MLAQVTRKLHTSVEKVAGVLLVSCGHSGSGGSKLAEHPAIKERTTEIH